MSKISYDPPEGGFFGLFNDSFPPIFDGVTLTVQNYVRWLKEFGASPSVVTPWNPVSEPTDYPVMRYFSLPIAWRKPYRYGYPKLDPFIWRRLRTTPFRLVHAHCPFSSGRLAVYVKKKQGVPLIGTFHSKYRADLEHGFRHTPWCVPIIMKRILDFFNACDEVWIPQARVEETVREYGYKGKLTVVENGIDFADMVEDSSLGKHKQDVRRKLGMDDGSINLLFVGQHIWEKGLRVILDTLQSLSLNGVPFRMNFIGIGYALEDARKIVESAGLSDRVKFHGMITDRQQLADFYAASDLFLFPSYYDNAPLVIREAAAFGTPAVLVKESTASEVISEGSNGFLVDSDSQAYASLITRLHTDRPLLSSVGIRARGSLVRSWRNVVEEVADRYASLLRRKGL